MYEYTNKRKINTDNNGQVLLLSVMVLSGVIISISLFVGYLMVQRLRQANIAVDSAQAFYLSDTGIEYELYRISLIKSDKADKIPDCPPDLSDNASFKTVVSIEGNTETDSSLGAIIKSTGYVGPEGRKTTRSQQDTSQAVNTASYLDNPSLFNRGCN